MTQIAPVLVRRGVNWETKKASFTFASMGLCLVSCQTIQSFQDVQLPAYAGVYFSECRHQDGAVRFSIGGQGPEQERLDAEWASRSNGDWSLASYSPFGQTLLQVSYQEVPASLAVKAKEATPLQNLTLDPDGFLRFDGQRIGIKADEVACLLEMKLPRAWLKKVIAQNQEPENLQIEVDDGERKIDLKLGKHGLKQEWVWMFDVRWSMYWGLRSEALRFELRHGPELILSSQSYPHLSARMIPVRDEK